MNDSTMIVGISHSEWRNKEMVKQLDLSGVRIYANTKDDVKDALDLVGERVYLSDYEDFETFEEGGLVEVNYSNGIAYPFFGGDGVGWFTYIIRAEDVKFKGEKKLRPFDSKCEFTEVTGCDIGDVITIHSTDGGFDEVCIVSGFKYLDTEPSKPSIVYIALGTDKYTFEELLQHFKYHKDDGWYPFGVEE